MTSVESLPVFLFMKRGTSASCLSLWFKCSPISISSGMWSHLMFTQ